ncbi:MAG: hypothetical protein EAS52_16840 [Parapedobacter sp.]|nr:MAG: hypothetical protein EAS52_16840 [Parapedobacter sp.]
MYKNGFLLLITIVAYSLSTVLLAQSKAGMDIDFTNIYNTHNTSIGIPVRDSVYIYNPSSSKSPTNWSVIESLSIPEGTIAMDGNIGKNIFMTKETIIFEEYGRYDTLRFHAGLPPIDPRLWIRTPHSTEVESYFLSGEKNVCYYREYDEDQKQFVWQVSDQLNPHMFKENRTQPVLKDKDGFYKLYSFIPGGGSEYLAAVFKHRISFFRYPMLHDALLGDKIIAPSELDFTLPQGAVTAFIYDFKYIAVVSQEQIDFYGFDSAQKKWKKAKGIPSLRFASLNQEK